MKTKGNFDEQHVLNELKHYLPSQAPLKDFIHHNTLHAFQDMKFFDAIFHASTIFGYNVTLSLDEYRGLYSMGRVNDKILEKLILEKKGNDHLAEWKEKIRFKAYDTSTSSRIGQLRKIWNEKCKLDFDSQIHPLLFRIICSYLDQGISIWSFPTTKSGFLKSIRELEKNSHTSFFKTKRARKLLFENITITDLLALIVGKEEYFEQYLFDQQFSHRGWSGMVASIESQPQSLLDTKIISIHDLIIFELLLEIDVLESQLGENWLTLTENAKVTNTDLFCINLPTELNEVLAIWQEAFEWSYYDEVLAVILSNKCKNDTSPESKSLQAIFCIDDRECSIRRHIEKINPKSETFGTPGFFGVEFYFQRENGKFYDKLCPAPITPKYLIKELDAKENNKSDLLFTKKSHTLMLGFFISIFYGLLAAFRMVTNIFNPKMSAAVYNAFSHMDQYSTLTFENLDPNEKENGLQIGFTYEEMAQRVESLLKGIGLTKNFSPLVYIIGHGASSANNPHYNGYNCGACSGRPGSVNSKVFSLMANHANVRNILETKGIQIPHDTHFIGGLHDTTSEQILFYDEGRLSTIHSEIHRKNMLDFEKALDLNAKERSRRFASINANQSARNIRNKITDRSASISEPRPELNHATNALCIVGDRSLTKGIFLDRRAFMNSYDYKSDPEGKNLLAIMKPLGPVCGGINLEYYFSRVDNKKLGAGTKLSFNLMGLFGVANGSDGDLMPGLPSQMIEVHDPVRLLIIVEHLPDVVLKTIKTVPEMYEWFINEWVHLMVFNPQTNQFHFFKNGAFTNYNPLIYEKTIESTKVAASTPITETTQENIRVYSLN